MAYGLLGLTPTEFRRVSLTEFRQMVRARSEYELERDKRWANWWREQLAWVVAHLLNIHVEEGSRVTIDDLLGRPAKDAETLKAKLAQAKRDKAKSGTRGSKT